MKHFKGQTNLTNLLNINRTVRCWGILLGILLFSTISSNSYAQICANPFGAAVPPTIVPASGIVPSYVDVAANATRENKDGEYRDISATCVARSYTVQSGAVYGFGVDNTSSYTFEVCYSNTQYPQPQIELYDEAGVYVTSETTVAVSATTSCKRITYTGCSDDVFLAVYSHDCISDWRPWTLSVACTPCTLTLQNDVYASATTGTCLASTVVVPTPDYCTDVTMSYRVLDCTGAEIIASTVYNYIANSAVNQTITLTDLSLGKYTVEWSYIPLCETDPVVIDLQNVIVTPIMACNDLIYIGLSSGCTTQITPDAILEDPCDDALAAGTIQYVVDVNHTGTNVVTGAYIGQTIPVTIKALVDDDCNAATPMTVVNSCWGNIQVIDEVSPVINCVSVFNRICGQGTEPSDLGPDGTPIIVDECSSVNTLTHNDIITNYDGCSEMNDGIDDDFALLYTITRTWTATDIYGNVGTCTQTIRVLRPLLTSAVPSASVAGHYILFPGSKADVAGLQNQLDGNAANNGANVNGTSDDAINCSSVTIGTDGNPIITEAVSGVPEFVIVVDADGDYSNDIRVPISNLCMLGYAHTDQVIPTCANSWKVIRTWTVLDWCNTLGVQVMSNVLTPQVIKIADVTAPTFACPNPNSIQVLYNNSYTCGSSKVVLPSVSVSDNCSPANLVSVRISSPSLGTINTNGGAFNNVPTGTHIFTYTATDNCNNFSTCTVSVTVTDQVDPVAVCEETRVVSLTSNGTAIIYADAFDDGSNDNCGIVSKKVRRMTSTCTNPTTTYGDFVEFCCNDLGTPIQVELQVADAGGRTNSCMVNVIVQDKTTPVITSCPANITISCGDNVPAVTQPTYQDNCSVSLDFNETSNIDACGRGTISRTWTLTNNNNTNSAVCTQVITVVNNGTFDEADIVWPADVTVNCDASTAVTSTGEPIVEDDDICDQVAFGYQDVDLQTVSSFCKKILRTWTVIDWCQYEASNGLTGRWSHVQVIKVQDLTAPTFVNPPVNTTLSVETNCQLSYTVPRPTVTDACDGLTGGSATLTATIQGSGSTTFGPFNGFSTYVLNSGTYKITYTASDNCGNISTHSYEITVRDNKKPTPVCIGSLTVTLMPTTRTVDIWATDFDNGSSNDNCTAYENLIFRIRRITLGETPLTTVPNTTSAQFDCTDVANGGFVAVQIWVGDEAGNWDYCTSVVQVQDNMLVPPCTSGGAPVVAGNIKNESGQNVDQVTINTLAGGSSMPVVTTDANGNYQIGSLSLGGNYTVSPVKNINPLNGVTTLDLVLISKHILGIQQLNSAYKVIAADVNKSGTITTLDMVELRKLILNIIPDFTNNTSWRFVDQTYQFANIATAASESFPEVYNINSINNDMSINFVGIKIGDVNGSAIPNNITANSDNRTSANNLVFGVEDREIKAGEEFTIPFVSDNFNDVAGFQFTMAYDKDALTYERFSGSDLNSMTDDNFAVAETEEGYVSASWNESKGATLEDGKKVFALTFKANKNAKLSDLFKISSRYIAPEAYIGNDLQLANVGIRFNDKQLLTAGYELYQNQPNPFKNETFISFNMAKAGVATVKVMDMTGKVIKSITGDFAKGFNQIRVAGLEANASGFYFYQLETDGFTASKKMLILE
ncbi:MAG: T9SS type A sorting domain-containing protein [Saprospiraceae bacterium]|nr:T9SS type A sorting domain-containing protein [Saprospiraceae bacterium]